MAFSLDMLSKKESLLPFRKQFGPGEVIFHQGQVGNTLFILLKGRVHLLLDSNTGEHVFSVASAGDILGEKAILQEKGHQRLFSAQAVEPVIAFEISAWDLGQLQRTEPDLILDILKRSFEVSAKRLEQANYLARVLRGTDSRRRFCECIVYAAHTAGSPTTNGIKIPKLKEALSYFLDLDPLKRDLFLNELIDSGALEVHDQTYVLVNQQKLMAGCIPKEGR